MKLYKQNNKKISRKKGMWDRILSLMLVLTLITSIFSGLSFTGNINVYADEDDGTITYAIDAKTIVTYDPYSGPYGTIYYEKQHYTTGSTIRYYTQKFVITMDSKATSDNLNLVNDPDAVVLDVSSDGSKAMSRDEAKAKADASGINFYWYDSPIGWDGYITTTYVIDGKYFYDLMQNAFTQGKSGTIYIHHVFAITGGTLSMSGGGHTEVNKPFYTYDELFKVQGWADKAATQKSQRDCLNVPVPYKRDISVITTYFDDNGKTVRTTRDTRDLDKVWDSSVPSEVSDFYGNTYKVKQSNDFSGPMYVWFKKQYAITGADSLSSERSTANEEITAFTNESFESVKRKMASDFTGTYGSLDPAGRAKNINKDTTKAGKFTEGEINTFSFDLENLGDKKTAWAIQLYVPVSNKISNTNVRLHFFDPVTDKAVGTSCTVANDVKINGKPYTVGSVDGYLIRANAGGDYMFDTDNKSRAFWVSGDDSEIVYDYDAAKKNVKKSGTWSGTDFTISSLGEKQYNVLWAPVKIKDKTALYSNVKYGYYDTESGARLAAPVDAAPPDAEYGKKGTFTGIGKPDGYEFNVTSEYPAFYAASDTSSDTTQYAKAKTRRSLDGAFDQKQGIFTIPAVPSKQYTTIWIPVKKVAPPPSDPTERTDVIIEYIDSSTGAVVKTTEDEAAVRGSLVTPKAPTGYSIDIEGKKKPLAISKTGIDRVTLAYDAATDASGYNKITFENAGKCTFTVPTGSSTRLAVKAFVPVKMESRQTSIYLKYCIMGNDGKIKTISNPISKGYEDFDTETRFSMDSTVDYNGDVYEVSGIARILHGNSSDTLVAKSSDNVMNIPIDGNGVMGEISNGTLASSKDSLTFTTASKGNYHVVYVYCQKLSASSMLTIHYIDANTGEELKKTTDTYTLLEAYELWVGINGRLETGITIPLARSFRKDSKTYQPVYLSEDPDIVKETKHNGACTKGELGHRYIDGTTYYCKECGLRRRMEKNGKATVSYDNNSYSDSKHNYSTFRYDTPFVTKAAYAKPTNKPSILAFDGSIKYGSMSSYESFRFEKDTCSIVLKTTESMYGYEDSLKVGMSPFAEIPLKKTEITAMTLYVPCVEVINTVDVTVKYITLKPNGKKDREVLTTDGGTAEKDTKYSYTGDTTIVGNDGKTYNVIGSGDALAYGTTNYITARDDTTNSKGQPVKYDGAGTWTTKKKYSSDEDGILYIPVEAEKEITVKIVYITLKDDGTIKSTITELDGPVAEEGKKYTYQGTSIVEKDGKTYIVTGEDDSASYDGNNYKTGKTDNTNTKGTTVTYDGTDTWTTDKKIPDIETVTIYIPVKEAKYEVTPIEPLGDITVSHMDPGASAVINAKKGTPFNVSTAIPSSEYIYSKVTARSYLVNAGFKNVTGLLDAEITVELPYVLYTKDKDGNIISSLTKTGKKTKKVTVSAPYSYWVLNSAALYSAKTGTVKNDSVDKNMKASFSPSVPSFDNSLSTALEDHVRFKTAVPETVTMPEVKVYGTEKSAPVAPTLQKELAQSFAVTKLPDVQVKNDSVKFNGNVVLKSAWTSVTSVTKPDVSKIPEAGKISAESADEQIPGEKANVRYASTGTMKYDLETKKGSADSSLTFDITGINAVNVHTPVVSYLTLDNDNLKYVQLSDADKTKVHLVVGRSEQADSTGYENSSNDFTIKVKNTGKHISAPGYGTLDTTKYILKQEIMFTFDVFADKGTDGKENNDILIKSGTWSEFDAADTFYLPEWVAEGDYTAKIRTVAINGADNISSEQKNANTTQTKYVAYDTVAVVVSGKMFGLTITSVNSEHADWKDVFVTGSKIKNAYPDTYTTDGTLKGITKFNKNYRYCYMSGLNNELGIPMVSRNDKYIFPMINGSSPAAEGTGLLKSGYTWNFRLQTEGTRTSVEKSAVVIIPSFYWISADGKTRERVDVWYTDKVAGKTQNFIKFGDAIDAQNKHTDYAASATMGIPAAEIKLLDAINGSKDRSTKNVTAYTYGEIKNNGYLRTFTGTSYADRMINRSIIAASKKNQASRYEQTWYFEYALPNTWHACPYDYDLAAYIRKAGGCNYKEDFWKKDGYLVVHFDIGAYDETGLIMTYANSAENVTDGMCDMWATEGYVTDRTDAKGIKFKFTEGDVFVVGIGKNTTAADDYKTDHLN